MAVQLALLLIRGAPIVMRLAKAKKTGEKIQSVISVSDDLVRSAGRDLLKFFRINRGKNAGQLTPKAVKGMNSPNATASSADKTQFAANVASGRQALTREQQSIIEQIRNKTLSLTEGRGRLIKVGMTAAGVAAIFPLLEDEDAETEYNVLTGQEVPKGGIRRDIEGRAFKADRRIAENFFQDSRLPRHDVYGRIKPEARQAMIDAELGRNRAPERRDIASLYRQQLAKDNPSLNPDTFMNAALGRQRQPRGSDFITEQRITAEKEAIAEADSSSPKFTSAELAPYKKIAESEFGQKLFGLRRSAPEIERDVTYTDLKMQGRDEEADKYWSDWNAENKAKKDAALGEEKSLTESTMNDANSFAEDIASAAKEFSTVVKEKLPTSKKGGGRVSSRPKSYRTAKVMKKYAKGGSVRKPKRI